MTSPDEWLKVESLDLEAQGVAHNAEGKVVFIEDALAGEEVQVHVRRRKNNWEQATWRAAQPSAQRVVPRCPHFGVCGGCKMQHLHVGAQVATKQRALEDALWHLGKVRPDQLLRPIEGPAWGYRQRARLSVRHVVKKGKVLVGFHERKSSYVADIHSCEVLPRACQRLLLPLRELVAAMRSARPPAADRGRGRRRDHGAGAAPPRAAERGGSRAAARASRRRTASSGGCSPRARTRCTARRRRPELAYALPEFGIRMPFRPTDFTQVNRDINQVLVGARAAPARAAAAPSGSSTGSAASATSRCRWRRARRRCSASRAARRWSSGRAPRRAERARRADAVRGARPVRADAGRSGAVRAGRHVAARSAARGRVRDRQGAGRAGRAPVPAVQPPRRIVYVSCNPATLARDAGLLVHQAGYRCSGGRRGQHVSAHRPRREHRGLRPTRA